MNATEVERMEAVLGAALVAVLPGACRLGSPSEESGGPARPLDVAVELDTGHSRWWLRVSAGPGSCVHLLTRMLGRAATSSEAKDMSIEALAEYCNLLAGHVAGILGAQGVEATIGIPHPAGDLGAATWQHWEFEGHPLALALQRVEKEPAA